MVKRSINRRSINRKFWEGFSDKEMDDFVEKIFVSYRETGFPYFPTDMSWRKKEFDKLIGFSGEIFENGCFRQTMHGLSLAWSYFPHSWEVRCNGLRTPMEAFLDDDIFHRVIRKRIRFGDNLSDNGIRKMLKVYSGTQSVSNFRPTTAWKLYDMYGNSGVVWDMSCGYGGRLLGFLKSEGLKYIGTEPCEKTFSGLSGIASDFGAGKEIQLVKSGSEDFVPEPESLDFCFTSPPYFDCEKYSDEPTQSYLKFPDRNSWIDGFLARTFENCMVGLKSGKHMALNIANVKSFPNLQAISCEIAEKIGFELVNTHWYMLSSLSGKETYKKEPIYVFRKR